MKKNLATLLFFLVVPFLEAQDVSRLVLDGIIIATNNDIEGISIFNTFTNKGATTNKEGQFSIRGALNDRLEISSLQFKKKI